MVRLPPKRFAQWLQERRNRSAAKALKVQEDHRQNPPGKAPPLGPAGRPGGGTG